MIDNVNHPAHYNQGKIETIDYNEETTLNVAQKIEESTNKIVESIDLLAVVIARSDLKGTDFAEVNRYLQGLKNEMEKFPNVAEIIINRYYSKGCVNDYDYSHTSRNMLLDAVLEKV